MPDTTDPFVHHPELRARIAEPESSYFRTFNIEALIKEHPHLEQFLPWTHADDEREAIRAAALAHHEGDLWVFAYGSLMWDPALRFAEVRRAYAPGHERRFILMDDKGGRGSKEAPGLMAALDTGAGCEGLAYRVRAEDVDEETEILFRREVIGPGYVPAFVPVRIGGTDATALTFLADHGYADIRGDIAWGDQVRYIATGAGFLGTSLQYLSNIVDHFAHLGIVDVHCTDLLEAVEAYRAESAPQEPAQ